MTANGMIRSASARCKGPFNDFVKWSRLREVGVLFAIRNAYCVVRVEDCGHEFFYFWAFLGGAYRD